jgi:DNA-binding beta-propeller fold protein YncE
MAAFITRTQDSALRRGSQRAALKQWATFKNSLLAALSSLANGSSPRLMASDGSDIWVANTGNGTVSRVRASDGALLGTWTGATGVFDVLVMPNLIWLTGQTSPGNIYGIDPRQPPGPVITFSLPGLGAYPTGIATDGQYIWTANFGGSVSKVNPNGTATTITTGFSQPVGILFDGTDIWVTDLGDNHLKQLDSNGGILQSVPVGSQPNFPVFDGSNIWVPNNADASVTVVRARDGVVLTTLTGNGLNLPSQAAFDGERILVTNFAGDSVSLWKATDLTPLGTFTSGPGSHPLGACSDGVHFLVTLNGFNYVLKL